MWNNKCIALWVISRHNATGRDNVVCYVSSYLCLLWVSSVWDGWEWWKMLLVSIIHGLRWNLWWGLPKSSVELLTEKDLISFVENFQLPLRSTMRVYTIEVVEYASFLVQLKRLLGIFPKRTLPNIQQFMKNQPISPYRLLMYHSSPSIKFQSFRSSWASLCW